MAPTDGPRPDDAPERSALASPWLTAALVLAATVLGALVALEVYDATEPADPQAAVPARVTDAGERDRLLRVAARAGERVLTYSHDSFDRDVEATRQGLTPEFAEEYAAAMGRVRADALADEVDQEATAVSSGVVSATDTRAEVLVFVNQETTAAHHGRPQRPAQPPRGQPRPPGRRVGRGRGHGARLGWQRPDGDEGVTGVPEVDLLIIGAGPTGLYAAYYAGFRGLRVGVVDSLPELGGQITAMYPEKAILDVAGFPTIKGRDLVEGLVAQAATADPQYFLDRTALTLEHGDEHVVVGLDDGTSISAGAVLDHRRHRQVQPAPAARGRRLGGPGRRVLRAVSFAPYAGKDVVIVGGGDSAFDWALHLEPVAASVTLVHRRDAFRAHERTVGPVRDSSVEIITKAQVTALRGRTGTAAGSSPRSRSPSTDRTRWSGPPRRWWPRSASSPTSAPLQTWGLETHKRHVVVDSAMRTNLQRVFAAGDITEYPGKVRLIAVGFGEAATAVNNAAVAIDPTAHVFPGHSSEGPEAGQRRISRTACSMWAEVSSALLRPVTQATSAASHTSPITRAMAASSSWPGLLRVHGPREHRGQQRPTPRISWRAEGSANMKARVSASVRCGSSCRPRVVRAQHVHDAVGGGVAPDGLLAQSASAARTPAPARRRAGGSWRGSSGRACRGRRRRARRRRASARRRSRPARPARSVASRMRSRRSAGRPLATGRTPPHPYAVSHLTGPHRQVSQACAMIGTRSTSRGRSPPVRIALLSYRSKPHCGGQGVYVRHLSRELVRPRPRGRGVLRPALPRPRRGRPADQGAQPRPLPRAGPVPYAAAERDPRPRSTSRRSSRCGRPASPSRKTFSPRVARLLRDRLDDFDVVHDNQVLGYGMLDIEKMGLPLVTTIHHPITFDRRIDLAAAPTWRKKLTLRRWYGFLQDAGQGRPRRRGRILTPSDIVGARHRPDFGVDPDRMRVILLGRRRGVRAADRAAGARPHPGDGQRRRPDEGHRDPARGLRQAAHRA